MKKAKFLLIAAGLVSVVGGALASSARILDKVYTLNHADGRCTITRTEATTVPTGAFISVLTATTIFDDNANCTAKSVYVGS